MTDTSIERLTPTHDLVPKDVVELFEGRTEVAADDHKADAHVRVWFEWERGVRVSASGQGRFAFALISEPTRLTTKVPGLGEVRVDRLDGDASIPDGEWTIEAVAVADAGNLEAPLDRVAFQVANFTTYRNRSTEGAPWRLTLTDDRWTVIIDQVADAADRNKRLKLTGGGAVTHACQLLRGNGAPFMWAEAVELLSGLQSLLSFVAGDCVPVLLPVGYGPDAEPVVQGLRSPNRESYSGRFRWCGPDLIDAVPDLWPKFLDMWQDAETRRLWQVAGELYVEAQHGDNLENRLVDAQNLLEVLAWDRLVRVCQLDPDAVDRKKAHRRIRGLLREIGAPVDIPTTLPDARHQWPSWDGPKVISELRNTVVHPTDLEALLQMPATTKHDVFRLAMWYADLALLKLLDHDGRHINRTGALRIWEGSGEPVPWSPAT